MRTRPGEVVSGPHGEEWGRAAWGIRDEPARAHAYIAPVTVLASGGGYGYFNAIRTTHSVLTHDEAAPVAVHVTPVGGFQPERDRLNVLLTMHETPTLAQCDADILAAPGLDWIVTPSEWCARIYERRGWRGRVTVAPLPILHGLFHPREERRDRWPDLPFQWLWVGSADPRKGQGVILLAWRRFFANRPEIHLTLKCTSPGKDGVETHGNITVNWCNLPTSELADLYRAADAFVFPSAGEGYGYPMVEAMASGLPVAATAGTATSDWVKPDTAWQIPHVWKRMNVYGARSEAPDGMYPMALASVLGTAQQMMAVMGDYPEALRRARRAHQYAIARARFDVYAGKIAEAVAGVTRKGRRATK